METYLPLWGFIALMVGTPGPANMMLMAAGASFGFAGLGPFLAGLVLGKLAMNTAISLGFGAYLLDSPAASGVLAYASAGVMVYLVLRGWTPPDAGGGDAGGGDAGGGDAGGADEGRGWDAGAHGFLVGMVVHPLSPKSWTMATLAYTQFSGGFDTGFEAYALIPLSFLALQTLAHCSWCLAGVAMRRRLTGNLAMHRALIVLTLAVILWALFQ